ncbi:MAG: anhydro-N-acetylmuramic acid kinase [Alcanivoracaceae bacterium]|nr:anhydro-N-acetylmuramic acid kinase [Alcanivoracaceae bacterium]
MNKYYIGLLSGTSVDGIDAAIVAIDENNIKLLCTHEQAFSSQLKAALQNIIKYQKVTLQQLSDTDSLLAFEFSQAVDILIKKSAVSKDEIMAIGSHGQTIFHQPDGNHRNTLQIGSAHILAANTDITVVSNFRNIDMAYGGQGAPLAPLIHQQLFTNKDKNTAVINLGGIANISFIGTDYKQPVGYDTGPANCLLDEWINIHQHKEFDKDGAWAQKGTLNPQLLKQMLKDDYFHKLAPKSTGREYFNYKWYDNFRELFKSTCAVDIQTTLTHLVASSISDAIEKEPHKIDNVILVGGGAKNGFLQSLIKKYSHIDTVSSCAYDYHPDWVEAILFAYLAYKRIYNQKLNLSSFTGSTSEILAGDIIIP